MELNLSAPNSQSFDEVLQKLKQSMKAARSGGWIDSDSGSELELALDHPPNGNHGGHPYRHGSATRSTHHPPLLYIKDGMDHRRGGVEDKLQANPTLAQTPLGTNRKTIIPRASDFSHLDTRPLTTTLNYHSFDPVSVSYPQEPRGSPIFDTSTNSYIFPRTPSTPASIGTSVGSPYVRHHFKWEYLPPATTGEGVQLHGSQPRFVESSSPPLEINHEEPYSVDWSRRFLSKESIFPPQSAQPQPYSDARCDFEIQAPISNPNLPSSMLNGYRSVSYSPTHGKSQSVPPHNVGAGCHNRFSGLENVPANMNSSKPASLEQLRKPWFSGAPSSGQKPHSQALLNPASVSSVLFSLAPAAPIRLTAPEANSQLESQGRKAIARSPPRQVDPPTTSAESNCVTTHASAPTSSSSVSLKDLAEEKEKEVIRARLMGSSSIDSFQTHFQNANKPFEAKSLPADVDHSAQIPHLPGLFQQMRFCNTTQPIVSSQARDQSVAASAPLRSASSSYPPNHTYCAPVFYSSHTHGTVIKEPSFAAPSSAISSPNAYQIAQLIPRTPVTPIGFSSHGQLHTPSSSIPYPPTPSLNKSSFVPRIVPAVPGVGGAVGTPLPGQVQPEEVRKSVKAQPPVVNTGNSGAMIPQPGDWMCICGFVNWRRRKVCMRCFPYADGNDSVGAMIALNAQRAALLAAGVPMSKDHSNSTGAISDSSQNFFQNPKNVSYPELGKQIADQKAKYDRIFSSPEPTFSFGRAVEPAARFASQAQGMTMNPFDKPKPLGPISPPRKDFHHSRDGESNGRYADGLPQKSLDRGGSYFECPNVNSESSPNVLRARGEEQNAEKGTWEESSTKSPRPRSFSMGSKGVWESSGEVPQAGISEAPGTKNSPKPERNPFGKETNGIPGSDESVGGKAISSLIVPDRHQELNTMSNNGSSVNQNRNITNPTSSWQAIKALWQ